MSYCRWSSDNFKSDVYVYADVGGGWTIHVAGMRIVNELPPDPSLVVYSEEPEKLTTEEFQQMYAAWYAAMATAERKPIGLPYDSKSFNVDTPGECADKLEELRSVGYNVPQRAIDALRDEEAQGIR